MTWLTRLHNSHVFNPHKVYLLAHKNLHILSQITGICHRIMGKVPALILIITFLQQ